MADEKQVELIVETRDQTIISDLEKSLQSVAVTRGRTARVLDPVTILTVTAAAVKLINELLTLREKMKKLESPPQIKVRGVSGGPIDLATADRDQLSKLVT